jgi:hypothetical protein
MRSSVCHTGSVAGGMSKRGGGMPMSERVGLSRGGDVAAEPQDDCPARHCWVLDPADRSHRRRPGILLEWRRTDAGTWEGRVAYVAELRPGLWAAVEEWIPASLVAAAVLEPPVSWH